MEKRIIKPNVNIVNILDFFTPIIKQEKEKYVKEYKKAQNKNVVAIILSIILSGVITYSILKLFKVPNNYKCIVAFTDFAMFSCISLYFAYIKPDRIYQICNKIKEDLSILHPYKLEEENIDFYVGDLAIIDLLNAKCVDDENYAILDIVEDIFPYSKTVAELEKSSDSSLYEVKEDKYNFPHGSEMKHLLLISEKINSKEYKNFRMETFNREDYSGAITLDFKYIDKRFEEAREKWVKK